jgi:hypothetical protein
MKRIIFVMAAAFMSAAIPVLAQNTASQSEEAPVDLRHALAALSSEGGVDTPMQIESCPGCCSSHGGVTQSCAGNGHIYCSDGTVSPSCLCSSCGVSVTPNCTGGQYWNGSSCTCPSGQSLVGGVCTTTVHTCTGGQLWNGSMCTCPSGQSLVGGVCTTPVRTCPGGRIWNGTTCECPAGQVVIGGQCTTASTTTFAIVPGITGTWVDAGMSNEAGVGIEILAGNQLLAEWYSYLPNGGQAYVGGVGAYSGNRATITGYQVSGPGALLTPNFNPSQTQVEAWGTMTFTFTDCNHGQMTWAHGGPDLLSGSVNLVRLTSPVGLICP